MDMRIEFEAAMAKQLSSEGYSDFSIEMMFERGSDDEYRSIRVNGAYWGWRASRESLVVELDPPHNDYENYTDSEVSGACKYYEQAKKHINATGIRTK